MSACCSEFTNCNHEQRPNETLIIAAIQEAIDGAPSPAEAAGAVKSILSERFDWEWEGKTKILWLTLLCRKWHEKTPDIEQQAAGIASGIMKQLKR